MLYIAQPGRADGPVERHRAAAAGGDGQVLGAVRVPVSALLNVTFAPAGVRRRSVVSMVGRACSIQSDRADKADRIAGGGDRARAGDRDRAGSRGADLREGTVGGDILRDREQAGVIQGHRASSGRRDAAGADGGRRVGDRAYRESVAVAIADISGHIRCKRGDVIAGVD